MTDTQPLSAALLLDAVIGKHTHAVEHLRQFIADLQQQVDAVNDNSLFRFNSPYTFEEIEHRYRRDCIAIRTSRTDLHHSVGLLMNAVLKERLAKRRVEKDRDHWKERATRAEANQRTPGTVEVCENCGDTFPLKKCDHPRDFTGEAWVRPCPIRQETKK